MKRKLDALYEFQPERLLSADGKSYTKLDALIRFAAGKRQCLGEIRARVSIFLYFTNIFHQYNIRLVDESNHTSAESIDGFWMAPEDSELM